MSDDERRPHNPRPPYMAGHPETTYEPHDDGGSRAAASAAMAVVVLAFVGGILLAVSLLSGCGSALADQCEALYAGADTPEKMIAADAACAPDGGAP